MKSSTFKAHVVRTLCAATGLLLFLPTIALAQPRDQRVVDAALATYVEGMTESIALREVGYDGVPTLVTLAADSSFPRHDNVIAMLGFLANDANHHQVANAVLSFILKDLPITSAADDRALIVALSRTLGRVSKKNAAAKAFLFNTIKHGGNGGPLAQVAKRYVTSDQDSELTTLVSSAIHSLPFLNDRTARTKLDRLVRGRDKPLRGKDLRDAARKAKEIQTELGLGATGGAGVTSLAAYLPGTDDHDHSAAAAGGAGDEVVAAGEPGYPDTATDEHEHRMTFANHVNVSNPHTDAQLDVSLSIASTFMGTSDVAGDIACCVKLARSAPTVTFGSANDGLDVIETDSELRTVLNHSAALGKVVRAINYCGGAGTNIIGCGWIGARGFAYVRYATPEAEARLIAHEYGHNVGLNHRSDITAIMNPTLYYGAGQVVGLNSGECSTYHSSFSPARIGACRDSDNNGVSDCIEGVGTACAPGCGNGIREAGEQCDGNDLAGATCSSVGKTGGTLSCTSSCTYDTSACTVCGNNVREPGEECDGADLNGNTCGTFNCTGGSVSCGQDCRLDTASCTGCPLCNGNLVCDPGENCVGCPTDCGGSDGGSRCGNKVCEPWGGENCSNCPQDCNGQTTGNQRNRYCCGSGGLSCGDNRCIANGKGCSANPTGPYCCGDSLCTGAENYYSCGVDCPAPPPPTCKNAGASCSAGSECCSSTCNRKKKCA